MSKVYCQSCGAEVVIPERSETVIGRTISKETNGNFVIPTYEKENKDMDNNTNGGMNMNGFDMNVLAQMVAEQLKNGMASNPLPVEEPKAEPQFPTTSAIGGKWATGSKYYGKVLCGQVFNPYMWRYWTAKQYMEMYNVPNTWAPHNVQAQVSKRYDYVWTIKYTIKEINKLAMLEERDPIAFEERKLCFDVDNCKRILLDFIQNTRNEINKIVAYNVNRSGLGDNVYIKFNGRYYVVAKVTEIINAKHKVERVPEFTEDYKYVMHRLDEVEKELNCFRTYTYYYRKDNTTYRRFAKIANKVEFLKRFYTKYKIHYSFMDCFIRTGAYYTMKSKIAFENKTFKGTRGDEAIRKLRLELNEHLEGYKYHAMLKEMLGDLR